MYLLKAACADVRGVPNTSSENGFECTNFTIEAKSWTIELLPDPLDAAAASEADVAEAEDEAQAWLDAEASDRRLFTEELLE